MKNPLEKLSEFERTIKIINADPTNLDNQRKGKQIKKKCLSIGVPVSIAGIVGIVTIIACIVTRRLDVNAILPFLLLAGFGFIYSIGWKIVSYAKKIHLDPKDAPTNSYETLSCPNCSTKNSLLSTHCYKCGTKLK